MLSIAEAGVDTWKPCWYVEEDGPAWRAMTQLATKGPPYARLVPDVIGRHRVLFNSESGLVAAEGHPIEDGLAQSDQLAAALDELTGALGDYGIQLPAEERDGFDSFGLDRRPGFDGLGRLDVTVDVGCDPLEGRAQLAGVAALDLHSLWERMPRYDGAHLNSVTWRSSRGVAARAYDKWVEQGQLGRRGERIRYEAQRRWGAGHRRTIDELTPLELHRQFHQRLGPLGRSTQGVRVMSQSNASRQLLEQVRDGHITIREAERAAGYQMLREHAKGRLLPEMTRQTDWERRQLLRKTGVVVSTQLTDEVEVDLHEVFDRAEPSVFG